MNEQAERENFEAWCLKRWSGDRGALSIEAADSRRAGQYTMVPVEFAWQTWSARASLSTPPQPAAGEATRFLTAEQIWASEKIMALNAALGLSMDKLIQLSAAMFEAATPQPTQAAAAEPVRQAGEGCPTYHLDKTEQAAIKRALLTSVTVLDPTPTEAATASEQRDAAPASTEPEIPVEAKSAANVWDHVDDALRVIELARAGDWNWCENIRCKYIELRIDMRDGGCLIKDSKGARINPSSLAKQYRGDHRYETWSKQRPELAQWQKETIEANRATTPASAAQDTAGER